MDFSSISEALSENSLRLFGGSDGTRIGEHEYLVFAISLSDFGTNIYGQETYQNYQKRCELLIGTCRLPYRSFYQVAIHLIRNSLKMYWTTVFSSNRKFVVLCIKLSSEFGMEVRV